MQPCQLAECAASLQLGSQIHHASPLGHTGCVWHADSPLGPLDAISTTQNLNRFMPTPSYRWHQQSQGVERGQNHSSPTQPEDLPPAEHTVPHLPRAETFRHQSCSPSRGGCLPSSCAEAPAGSCPQAAPPPPALQLGVTSTQFLLAPLCTSPSFRPGSASSLSLHHICSGRVLTSPKTPQVDCSCTQSSNCLLGGHSR